MRLPFRSTMQAVTRSATKTKLPALTAGYIIALLAPLLSFTGTAHAICGYTCTYSDAWGTQEVAGSSWMSGNGVPIYSNGPSAPGGPSPDTYNHINNINGTSTTTGIEWQCVELVNRLYLTKGWTTATWSGYGYELYGNAPVYGSAPTGLTKQAQGSITFIHPGDVIGMSGGTQGFGHVAVASSVSGSSVTIASQNTNAVYDTSFGLSSGSITYSGWANYTMLGVVHHPTQGNTPNPNDFAGDDHSDLMFLHELSDNASANMYIYNQANSFASPGLVRQYASSSGWNWNQMKIGTGDADNNGVSDLFMLHKSSDGGANLYIFYGGSSSFADTSPVLQLPGTSGWNFDSMKILVGDYDGDQRADVMILHKLSDGGANVYVYTKAGSYTSPGLVRALPGTSGWNWDNMKLASGDVDNDGASDLLMLHKLSDGGANLYIFYGGQFTTPSPTRTLAGTSGWSWDKMKVQTGDFDDDKRADLIMLHELSDNASANVYVFTATSGFTIPSASRSFQASSGWDWNKMKISTGDVDNDGYADLLMLHKLSDSGANFYFFRGGPGQLADSSPLINFPGISGWSWDKMLAPQYVK